MISKKKQTNSFVPEDLLFLIFSRLPVKSLLRFCCVSKSICSLIDSPNFVKEHLDQSMEKRSDTDIIIAREPCGLCADVFSLDFCLPGYLNFAEARRLDCPIKDVFGPIEELKLVGTCNGILCLANCQSPLGFLLWNPSTGKFRKIETSFGYDESFDTYYFGYNQVQDDYILVRFSKGYTENGRRYLTSDRIEVYSSRMDSWKKINGKFPFPCLFTFRHYGGIFVHNAIHWLAGTDAERGAEFITALDLERETFRVVPTPPDEYRIGCLGELVGRLCMNYYKPSKYTTEYPLWVMEEYGNQESWTPLLRISIRPGWFQKPVAYSRCGRYLLAHFQHGSSLVWCHLDGAASEIAIDGVPDDVCDKGPFLMSIDACLCLRTP